MKINKKVITDRVLWVNRMIESIGKLPFSTKEEFFNDPRNVASAESYLRRALEALLDMGRHILAKGFANPVAEYKDIAKGLIERRVLPENEGAFLLKMAGYRNRMVHFLS